MAPLVHEHGWSLDEHDLIAAATIGGHVIECGTQCTGGNLEDWHRARYLVLPGMTGLWQISGRSGLSFDDLVRLDFTYLDNWSIWLDISIIAKTIPTVISGQGAY